MAYVKAYDAAGAGLNIRSGTFVTNSSSSLTLTYSSVTDWDADTAFIYEEYNNGFVTFGAFADWLGGYQFSLQSFIYENASGRTLVEAYNLNIHFDSRDDFSGGAIFSNMFAGNDKIIGNRYADSIHLGLGNDNGVGNAGNDKLWGEAGNDILNGGTGADFLSGGRGRDVIYVGADQSADVIVFDDDDIGKGATRDVVLQFDSGEDMINFRSIDANISRGVDQAFAYAGKHGLSYGKAHAVWYVDTGANILVRGDVDGDGKFDGEIEFRSLAQLAKSDFLL